MARTVLQMINQTQQELGLAQSATAFGNTDPTTTQMVGILQAGLEEIGRLHIWSTLMTQFNLVVQAPITTFTGNTTINSSILTNMSSTVGITAPYWIVQGTGIPVDARITAVGPGNQLTMNMQATSTNTAVTFTFAQDTYALPLDFDYLQSRTWWDRTNRWELLGPDSPQLDQWHRSGIVTTGPRRHFRIIGPNANQLRFWPPPAEISNPIQTVFEYISRNKVYVNGNVGTGTTPAGSDILWNQQVIDWGGTAATTASVFANDADQPILDDRLLIHWTKKEFWKIKGFNPAAFEDDYDRHLERLIARDGANMTLNITKRVNPIFVSPANVQDGFFPGPIGPNTG